MAKRIALFAVALASVTTAAADTSLLVWSSLRSTALDSLPSNIYSAKYLSNFLHNDNICDYDAVVFVQQPRDLPVLSPSSHIARSISSAASARNIKVSGSLDIPLTAQSLTSHCESRFLQYSPGPTSSGPVAFEEGKKHVLYLQVPRPHDGSNMEKYDVTLEAELATIASVFPSHLIFYSGPAVSSLRVRQAPDGAGPSRPVIEVANSTLPSAPGQSDQFFTTGLVTALLIVFFILLPALIIGIQALASVQTPTRMDAPKGYSATEKKNQ